MSDYIHNIENVCSVLGLSEQITRSAVSYYKDLHQCYMEDMKDDNFKWTVCLVYVAVVNARFPYGISDPQTLSLDVMAVTVTELLKVTKLRVGEFIQRMKMLKECWSLSEAVLQHFLQVERKYLILCPLFFKFEKVFDDIFLRSSSDSVENDSSPCDVGYVDRKEFCWTLFVYIRAFIQQGGSQELVLSFHLLLCCLEYIVRLTPSFELRSPFDAIRILTTTTSNVDGDILRELCTRYQANINEVRFVQVEYFDPGLQGLPHKDEVINVSLLIDEIGNQYRIAGDINELDFLANEPYLSVPNHSGETNINKGTVSNSVGTPTSRSGIQAGLHLTPVRIFEDVLTIRLRIMNRAAMHLIQQLTSLLQNSSSQSTLALLKYLNSCSVNPSGSMKDRLAQMEVVFVGKYTALMGVRRERLAKERFKLASTLYYHVMEIMLRLEEERLAQHDFSGLLNKEIFHKSLLACSVEVVLFTYDSQVTSNVRSPGLSLIDVESCGVLFPWILEVFELKAFDFFKVLESFIRAEPQLSADVIKHLHGVESKILESYAWKSDSSLFELLPQGGDCPHPTLPRSGSGDQIESLNVSPNLIAQSPLRQHQLDMSSVSESPSVSPRKSRSLTLFFNKVFRLGFQRLQTMCSVLEVTSDLQYKIWTCFEYCIKEKSILFQNRHLDQILMCCIYGVCKVLEREIKFKVIVSVYRNVMPNASQQIFKEVLITGSDYDSIIAFYNKVFMQVLKTYLLRFSTTKSPLSTQSPVTRKVNSQLSPCYQMPGRQNFYISPMKKTAKSPFKLPLSPTHMTPGTRQLYSFGGSPISSLRSVSERSRLSGTSVAVNPRSSKCLRFDQMDHPSSCRTDATVQDDVLKHKPPSSSRKSLSFEDEGNGS